MRFHRERRAPRGERAGDGAGAGVGRRDPIEAASRSVCSRLEQRSTSVPCRTHRALARPGQCEPYAVALTAAGTRVGVSSQSHKAINNLLAGIEAVAAEAGTTFSGVKKVNKRADAG